MWGCVATKGKHELDCIATWWLSEAPERSVVGSLKFDEQGGGVVELVDMLVPEPQRELGRIQPGVVVHGRDAGGRAITLLDAQPSGYRVHYGDDGERHLAQYLRARTVLTGSSWPPSEASFTACNFSFHGLTEWTASHFDLLQNPPAGDDGQPVFGVILQEVSRIDMETPGGGLSLWAGVSSSVGTVRQEYEVVTKWRWVPNQASTFDEIWRQVIHPLESFHTLMTTEATYPIALELELPPRPGDPHELPNRLEVFSASAIPSGVTVGRYSKWSVRIDDIAPRLDEVVNRWLTVYAEAEQGLVLLFATLDRKKDLYLDNRYLMICQAAEAYHRHRSVFPNRVLDDEEHARRLATILEKTPPEWRDWLSPRLQFAYEPTFRRRLRELRDYLGEFGDRLLGPSALQQIVRIRNELTHGLEFDDSDERIEQTVLCSEKLALTLRACLLRDLGFGEEEIPTRLVRDEYAGFVVDYSP